MNPGKVVNNTIINCMIGSHDLCYSLPLSSWVVYLTTNPNLQQLTEPLEGISEVRATITMALRGGRNSRGEVRDSNAILMLVSVLTSSTSA